MTIPGIATAADYSEAISVAKRAKTVVAFLLMLMLALQITIFALVQFGVIQIGGSTTTLRTPDISATQPINDPSVATSRLGDVMHYATGVTLLGGIGLSVILMLLLMLIAHIMLVGRLIGVGRVISGVVWSIILLVFFFPWQYFMSSSALAMADWKIPGVLWTWTEMTARVPGGHDWSSTGWSNSLLFWFRFAGAPLVALLLTLIVQLKSSRGVRMAMGEDDIMNGAMNDTL